MAAALGSTSCSVLDGKYGLIRELGSGGTGTVYEAEHLIVGKLVAIKVMNPGAADEPDYRSRFVAEARAAARIAHANVVDIYDMGVTEEGVPYLVMELLSGETLQYIIDTRGPLPAAYACELMLQVLAGLAAAHVHGIIHCDLKPANVIVTHPRPDRPLVKVLDFGIARTLTEIQTGGSKPRPLLGTPLYMAPEQVRGTEVDARTDVYSAASILWAMLAGRDPFEGTTARAVLQQVVKGERRNLLEINPRVAPALAAIVLRGLSVDPDERIASAGDFAELLWPFVHLDRMVSLSPARQLSSDPIPLVPTPRRGARGPLSQPTDLAGHDFPQSSVLPVMRRSPALTHSLLVSPRIPRAPTTPRLEAGRDFRPFPISASWQPVIREKATRRLPRSVMSSSLSALLATSIGFGIGILLAWLTGVL